jgi:hypothetical protein
MAKGKRIWIADNGPYTALPTLKWPTAAASTIDEGMLLKQTTAGDDPVTPIVTGDLTIETDTMLVGLAADDSTNTSAAAGYVNAYMLLPGVIYEAFCTTAASADTQAEIDAMIGDRVTFTISATTVAGNWSIDTTDSADSAFVVVGGDATKKTLRFMIRDDATVMGQSKIT